MSATIDEIRLKDIGSDSGGAAMAEITSIIVKAIFAAIPASYVARIPASGSPDEVEERAVAVLRERLGLLRPASDSQPA